CDAEAWCDVVSYRAIFEIRRRAWRGWAEGFMADGQFYALPWGFSLEDIHVPVRLWHGKQDRAFSVDLAEEVRRRLPGCNARFIDNAGHYSLPIRHMREILEDLVSA